MKRYVLGLLGALLLCVSLTMTAGAATSAQNEVFDYLVGNMQLNPAAASGVMANIQAESGFQSGISGLGGAFGLCQWGGGRITRLRSYCASHGLNASSIHGQLQYLDYELKNYYPRVWNYLRQVSNDAQGAYNAASYWCLYFEIPANRFARAAQRGSIARSTYWPEFGGRALYVTVSSSKNGVKIKWNKKTSAMRIMRSATYSGKYTEVGTVKKGTTSFNDTTAKKRKKYYYYVVPVTKGKKAVKAVGSNRAMITAQRTLRDKDVTITIPEETYTFTGKPYRPKVKITYGEDKLKLGRDFVVTYRNNVNVGTATIIIQGRNSYTGTVKRTVEIGRAQWKVKVKDVSIKLAKKKLVLTKIPGKYRFVSADPTIVEAAGQSLKLKAVGECDITLHIKKDKTHEALEKTFHVTVR